MKKTLTAIALFAALATGATTVQANPHMGHNAGLQNYYYYFGAPCCDRPMAMGAPCGDTTPCASPCNTCCEPQVVPVEMGPVCRTCTTPCGC